MLGSFNARTSDLDTCDFEPHAVVGGTCSVSHDNISDDPSRECYSLREAVGAVWRKPVLASVYDPVHPLGSLDTLALHVAKLRAQ